MTDKRTTWFRGWKLFLLVYLALLATSHVWRAFNPDVHKPDPGQQTVVLNQVSGDSVLMQKKMRLAYRDVYGGEEPNPPVLLLLHGSPVGVPMLPELIEALARENRVIAPDFPGYDASDRRIPDYSMKAYSVYMNQLLDSLGVRSGHVIGYSMGGGVAIQMSHRFPDKVESIVMLSGLGVQELELLGSYNLNHAVHAAQLALIWLLHEGVPHFGLLRDFPLNVPYARSFYDSDQRPLRGYLQQYRKPMLILHGKEDGLVPLAAAREHHRIVPQSRLILYEGGHGMVISDAERLAGDINTFIQRVRSGEAVSYAEASRERIRESNKPFENVDFARAEGITLLLLMGIIIFSTWISEDLTCIGAGLLAARGIIGFWPATAACFIGIFIGDVGLYLAGRWMGRPAVKQPPFSWLLNETDLKQSADWFKARGPAIIIASRFIPGSRLPTYFSAGVIGAGFWMFTGYFVFAALVWTPLLVGGAMLIGSELIRYFELYKNYAIWVLPAAAGILLLFSKFVVPAFTWRGRRLIVSRWRRLTRWEYWPPYLLYAPVVAYIGFLWMRFGKLTLFTAANPGIEDGGFIGESKTEILKKLQCSSKVPVFKRIDGSLDAWGKFLEARSFIKENGLEYPVVIKPDIGQRGNGVRIPKNEQELQLVLQQTDYEPIIQKYVEGQEYGLFYYRYPDEDHGRLFSITEKHLLSVTGDGEKTLEELILSDDRAVSMAKHHFRKHRESLYTIPGSGEVIPLVELGTHARGAIFTDGWDLYTPELERAVDRIASAFEGFFFGRFDIRVPDSDCLKMGQEIKILEANGVTSEATSIYDPDKSFIQAIGTLCKQWRMAFEIGEQNFRRGVEPSSVGTLAKKLIEYRRHGVWHEA